VSHKATGAFFTLRAIPGCFASSSSSVSGNVYKKSTVLLLPKLFFGIATLLASKESYAGWEEKASE
jgi:hypothetical protein